ncbi:MAG: bifunctional nuclease family protein [Polyangiaceae bacterium]
MRWLVFALLPSCAAAPPPLASAPAVMVEPSAPTPTVQPEPAPLPSEKVMAPSGYVEMVVADVAESTGGFAVALTDADRSVMVPIFVGGTEALAIDLRHGKRRFSRPLTHDLLDAVMEELGGKLVKVQVDAIVDEVFIGSIYVRRGGEVLELDARPSDAIALALGAEVPIYVRQTVIDEAGIPAPPQGVPADGGST